MRDLLVTSGLIQVTFGVLLGWVLVGLHAGKEKIGPLVNARRVLQCHLDNIFMGILQMIIATIFPELPMIAGWLLLVGSWANPQLFMYQATVKGPGQDLPGIRAIAAISFTVITVAYLWLVVAWIIR